MSTSWKSSRRSTKDPSCRWGALHMQYARLPMPDCTFGCQQLQTDSKLRAWVWWEGPCSRYTRNWRNDQSFPSLKDNASKVLRQILQICWAQNCSNIWVPRCLGSWRALLRQNTAKIVLWNQATVWGEWHQDAQTGTRKTTWAFSCFAGASENSGQEPKFWWNE